MNILVNFLLNNEDTMLDIVVQICILHSLKYNYWLLLCNLGYLAYSV